MAIDRNQVIKEAQKFVAKGQFDKAIAEWMKIAKDSPDDPNVFNTIGDLCLKKNSKSEAVDAYQKAADLLAADGFTSKAIALYKKVLNIDPKKVEAHLALADLNAEKGLSGNALESYKIVADHYTKNKETKKALGIYQKMADLNTANLAFRLKLADMYAKEGMKDEAVKAYLQAADVHVEKQAYKDARQLFEKALALDANNKDVYHKAGLVYFKEGKFTEACKALKPVFEADPANTELADLYLDSLAKAGRGAEAAEVYQKQLAKAPDNAELRQKLYQLYLSQQDYDKAFAEVSTLVAARIQSKDLETAEQMLTEFTRQAPRNIDGKRALSALYKTVGKAAEAADALVEAAEILVEEGAGDDAKELLARALELVPAHATARRRMDSLEPPKLTPEPKAAVERLEIPGPAPEPETVVEPLEIPGTAPEPEPFVEPLEIPESAPEPEAVVEPLELAEPEPEPARPQPAARPLRAAPAPAVAAAPPAPAAPAEDPAVSAALIEIDVLIKYGLQTKALEQLEALAVKFPMSVQLRIKLRDLCGDLGNPSKAVGHMLALADIYTEQGRLDEAEDMLQSARAMDPNHPQVIARFGVAAAAPAAAEPEEPVLMEELAPELGEPVAAEAPAEPAAGAGEPGEIDFGQPFTPDFEMPPAQAVPEEAVEPLPEQYEELAEDAEPVAEQELESVDLAPAPFAEAGPAEPAEMPAFAPFEEPVKAEQPAPEQFDLNEILAEAEFYYQQGLFDEARKHYERILEHVPDHQKARDRIAEISRDQEDAQEFSKLAEAVDGLEGLMGLAPQAGPSAQELPTSVSDEEAVRNLMQEIAQLKQKPQPPREKAPRETARPAPASPQPQRPAPQPVARAEEDFFDLGEELSRAPAAAASPFEEPAAAQSEADDFFDLASELREELSTVSVPASSSSAAEDQSLDDIFEEFKKGVEQQTIKEDVDTHYNLGVAYKEMGLLDDAIGEFIMTPEDEPKYMQSRYMLGLCYMEKGDYENAIIEIQLALQHAALSGITSRDLIGMQYDLGLAFQGAGRLDGALMQFQKVYAADRNYRDVTDKVRELQDGEVISMSDLKDDIEREISSKFLEEGERIEREEKTRKNQRVRN